MIIDYKENAIFVTADDPDENKHIMSCFNDSGFFALKNKVAYKNGGIWRLDTKLLDKLNMSLIPLKKNIRLTDDFKTWLNNVREARKPLQKGEFVVIKVGVVETKIFPYGHQIDYDKLQKNMRYFFKGAAMMKSYKEGKWDGYVKLFNKVTKTFPTGLLFDATKLLDKMKVPYKLKFDYDVAPPRQFDWEVCDNIVPDPDQIEAVEKALHGRRGIVKAPTGFGKTAILAKRLVAGHGVPSLFIANKKMLLDDAAKEFLNGIKGLDDVDAIKDGWFGKQKIDKDTKHVEPLTAPVVVATIQSLHARLEDPRTAEVLRDWLHNTCKFIMVDECQAVGSKMWDDVLNEVWAPYRIMLSATPRRTDGATIKIKAASGEVLFTTTADEQIEKGRLCEIEMNMVKYDHKLYNEWDKDLDYATYYKSCIVYNDERNKLICSLADKLVKEDRSTLVLFKNIDHGKILYDMFLGMGYTENDVRLVWGDTSNKRRIAAINDFRSGKYKILIGSTIFDAGANIPAIAGVVLAGAGGNEDDVTLIQRIGRAARNCDYEKALGRVPDFMKGLDKKVSVIYDILDVNAKFFRKQSRLRYETARTEFGKDRIHLVDATTKDLRAPKKETENLAQVESMSFSMDGKAIGLDELRKMFE